MTDTLTEIDPEALRRELVRLFAEPKSLHHIVSAGLDGVRRQLAELREAIEGAENGADKVVATVAELANLVRQEQRKHKGAVAQAKKEHARAEQLAAEVERLRAQLANSLRAVAERDAEQQRGSEQWARHAAATIYAYFGITPGTFGAYGEGGRKAVELIAPAHVLAEFGASPVLCGETIPSPLGNGVLVGPCIRHAHHPGDEHEAADGPKWAEPAVRPKACWCGHDTNSHTTDGGDNAVCRSCMTVAQIHRAFHVHAPERP